MSYEITSRVRYSEIDPESKLTPAGTINYLQDCTTFHDLDAGMGVDYWKRTGAGWIICAWNILLGDLPKYGEKIRIRTDCYKLRSFLGWRTYRIFGEDGRVAVAADSKWALMDLENLKPRKVTEEVAKAYGNDAHIPLKWESKHIVLPENMQINDPITVTHMQLDTNMHVNNEQYLNIAMPYLPADFEIKKMCIEYKAQAKEGDLIIPKTAALGNDKIVALDDENDNSYCILKFYGALTDEDRELFNS